MINSELNFCTSIWAIHLILVRAWITAREYAKIEFVGRYPSAFCIQPHRNENNFCFDTHPALLKRLRFSKKCCELRLSHRVGYWSLKVGEFENIKDLSSIYLRKHKMKFGTTTSTEQENWYENILGDIAYLLYNVVLNTVNVKVTFLRNSLD